MEKKQFAALAAIALVMMLAGCLEQTQYAPQGNDFAPNPNQTGQPFGQRPDATYTPQLPSGANAPQSDGALPPTGGNMQYPQPPQGNGTRIPPLDGNQRPQPPQENGAPAPQINADAPLPAAPQGAPEGKNVTVKLGQVEIRGFSTAIARGMMESGTDYFITLKNTGAQNAQVGFDSYGELRKFVPSWNLHFFSLQNPPIELAAGEEKKLWYFASLDAAGTFGVNFTFWLGNDKSSTATLPVTFGATEERNWQATSYINGTVTDADGKPVEGAQVVAMANCGRANYDAISDARGRYAVPVPGMEDVEAIYLGRELACDSEDYWVSVEKEGYEYYYKAGIAPTRTQPAQLMIVLEKKAESAEYSLSWEKKVDDNYGFFWVKPSADWSVFAAAQSKHPPELGKPTNFYLFDANGAVLWKQATKNECWGIDIAKDASTVVAGCHDNTVYAVARDGSLLWKYETAGMVRSACISNDGGTVLSGPMNPLYLFDAKTGTRKEIKWDGDWLRNCAFYSDGSGFVVGSREIAGFGIDGTQKWRNIIGEFPLFMAVDSDKNVYATGKVRTIFSFDANGKLRWKHKITEPTITAGAITPDGSRIAAGSVGGTVYLFDKNGTLLWKRGTLGTGQAGAVGHNAIAISKDGKRVVAGTDSNCVVVFNEKGTTLWKRCITPDSSNPDLKMGATNVQISDDYAQIVASYGDNYIRKYELK